MSRSPGLIALLLTVTAVSACDSPSGLDNGCRENCGTVTPPVGTWSNMVSMPTARHEMTAAELDGRIYIAGGLDMVDRILTTVEAFAPSVNAWVTMPDLPEPRHHHGTVGVAGRLYVIGGYSTGGAPPAPWQPSAAVFELDPATRTWRERAPLPVPLAAMAVATLGGRIYVFGGIGGLQPSRSTYVYDPVSDVWSEAAAMPTPREHVHAAVIGSTIYVVGGRGGGNPRVAEAYSPATDTWTTLAQLHQGRSGHGLAVLHGKLYALGGESLPYEIYNSVERYDPSAGTWETFMTMPAPKRGMGVAVVNDRIHVIGGSGSGSANWVFRLAD